MSPQPPAPDLSLTRLCRWVLHYAVRRRLPLLAVMATMLLQVGLSVLKPWPMVVLLDYLLGDKPMSPGLRRLVGLLPGAHTAEALIGWTVGATVLIFLLSWAVGLVNDTPALASASG